MEIKRWNYIMEKFQELLGWEQGIDAVIDVKAKYFSGIDIRTITGRNEKFLVHMLRKEYKIQEDRQNFLKNRRNNK